MTTPVFDLNHFEGRDDDVTLNNATFNGGGGTDTNWTQDVDINFRIRFSVQETASGMSANQNFSLHYNHEGGGFNPVNGASSVVRSFDTSQYADDDTTTLVIGSGTYVAGDSEGGDELTGTPGVTGNIDYGGSDEAEMEFCVQIIGADVNDEETIVFKLQTKAPADVPESVTLTITVNKAAGPVDPFRLGTFVRQAVNRAAT